MGVAHNMEWCEGEGEKIETRRYRGRVKNRDSKSWMEDIGGERIEGLMRIGECGG